MIIVPLWCGTDGNFDAPCRLGNVHAGTNYLGWGVKIDVLDQFVDSPSLKPSLKNAATATIPVAAIKV